MGKALKPARSGDSACSGGSFEHLCITAGSTVNNQEELEVCVQFHDLSAVMDGYGLCRKGRMGRPGGRLAPYVRKQLEYMAVFLRMGVTLLRICYPDHEGGDKAFFKQPG